MTPLNTEMLDELRWYFEQARAHPAPSRSPDLDERFYRARDAFSEPRFKALYRVWKEDGDTAFAACRSTRARRGRDGRRRARGDPGAWSPLWPSLPPGCCRIRSNSWLCLSTLGSRRCHCREALPIQKHATVSGAGIIPP